MRSFTIAALLALGASLVSATPTPNQVDVRQDDSFPYPIVATYEAVMREVDPEFQAFLEENVVIRLDEPLKKRDIKERQSGTCDIQGYGGLLLLLLPPPSFSRYPEATPPSPPPPTELPQESHG